MSQALTLYNTMSEQHKEEKCEETTVRNVPYMKANQTQQETTTINVTEGSAN